MPISTLAHSYQSELPMTNEVIVVTPLEILVVAAPAIVLGYLGNSRLGIRRAIIGCIIFVCLWFLSLTPTLDKAVTVLLVVALGFCSGLFFPLAKRKAPSGPIRFRYCPNCSSRLESRQIDGNMLDACPSCDFVHWNNPITVGVIVIPSGDGIVLVKRGNPPKKGMWALPGGFGNPNECPHNTAVREALEETSLVVEIDRLLTVMGTPDCNQTIVFYLAKPVNESPVADSDALEAKVFPLDALPEIAFETHAQIIAEWARSRSATNS